MQYRETIDRPKWVWISPNGSRQNSKNKRASKSMQTDNEKESHPLRGG